MMSVVVVISWCMSERALRAHGVRQPVTRRAKTRSGDGGSEWCSFRAAEEVR
jgi:hypothetical protein